VKLGPLDRKRNAAATKLRLVIDAWLDEVKLPRLVATDVIAEVSSSYVRAGLRGEGYPPTRAEQPAAVDRDLAEHGVDHFFSDTNLIRDMMADYEQRHGVPPTHIALPGQDITEAVPLSSVLGDDENNENRGNR
jgi:hypothetical protein